jgi:CheY-like chemotaxis protein
MKHDRTTRSPAVGEGESLDRRAEHAPIVDVAAAVAHEVANAVGAIAGWAELGLNPDGSGVDPRAALALIANCARTAEQAARRMLSLARGERPEDAEAALDVSQLSSELLSLLSITARQARVTLSSTLEPGLELRGSRGQWFTVLWNLVKNAVEASPAGAVVSVHLYGDETNVNLEIRDTGPGLDAAAQARIFLPYVTSKAQGTGIGLPLVRQAVDAFGGRLKLDSVVGQGSCFHVSVPRSVRQSDVHSALPESGRPASDEAPKSAHLLDARVLVVDDDAALREMLATALSLRGARVVSAASSAEANALEGMFDVALIDMTLGDCRGDELLAQLRRRGIVNAAMLVTGTVQKPKLVPGGEPDDWVRKPFEITQLVDRLKRTLERHRMLHAAAAGMRR